MNTLFARSLAVVFVSAVAASSGYAQDKVYQCGSTFQSQPCEGGKQVELPKVQRYHPEAGQSGHESKSAVSKSEPASTAATPTATPKSAAAAKKKAADQDADQTVSIAGRDVTKLGKKPGRR
jgi:hypothetical protein